MGTNSIELINSLRSELLRLQVERDLYKEKMEKAEEERDNYCRKLKILEKEREEEKEEKKKEKKKEREIVGERDTPTQEFEF